MKKIFLLVLMLFASFGLMSCSNDNAKTTSNNGSTKDFTVSIPNWYAIDTKNSFTLNGNIGKKTTAYGPFYIPKFVCNVEIVQGNLSYNNKEYTPMSFDELNGEADLDNLIFSNNNYYVLVAENSISPYNCTIRSISRQVYFTIINGDEVIEYYCLIPIPYYNWELEAVYSVEENKSYYDFIPNNVNNYFDLEPYENAKEFYSKFTNYVELNEDNKTVTFLTSDLKDSRKYNIVIDYENEQLSFIDDETSYIIYDRNVEQEVFISSSN